MLQNMRHAQLARPALARLLLAGVVLLGLAVAVTVFAGSAGAGDGTVVTVNTTANIDDGECEGAPNDGAGNCSLHEAIDDVNAGLADIIRFHPPAFGKEDPGVIQIDDGEECLPDIERDVIIDSPDTGVVIDGDIDDDNTPVDCEAGLHVTPTSNGADFTLIGGKNFEIREIGNGADFDEGNGILLDGGDFKDYVDHFSFGDVDISGVTIRKVCEDGIKITATINLNDGLLTNNDIRATYPEFEGFTPGDLGFCEGDGDGDDGIDVHIDSTLPLFDGDLTDNMLEISDSLIVGDDHGVRAEYEQDLGSELHIDVINNEQLTGLGDEGVHLLYCEDGDPCDAGDSAVYMHVNENAKIHGDTEGVEIDIHADDTPFDAFESTITDVEVNDNLRIDGDGGSDDGVEIDVEICCDGSNSVSNASVNRNEDIVGDDDGIDIDIEVCCGDHNISNVYVNDNESIEGQDDDGVDVDVDLGDTGDGASGRAMKTLTPTRVLSR